MSDDEAVELIILVHGNFLPVLIQRKQVAEMDAMIETTLSDPDKAERWLIFTSDGLPRRVHPKAIQGWYFRKRVAPLSEEALKVMQRMEKKMPDGNEGEDWKG